MNEATKHEWDLFPVYIALGSNIEPEKNLPETIQKLKSVFDIVAESSVWQTPSVGFEGEDFLNAVVLFKTPISANTLKNEILRPFEALLGRIRTEEKFSSRTIDLDILIFNEDIVEHELWEQAHLAVPLAELKPELRRQETGETLEEISQALQKTSQILLREDIKINQAE